MTKRILTTFVMFGFLCAAVVTLSSCGKSEPAAEEETQTTTQGETETEEAAVEETPEEPAKEAEAEEAAEAEEEAEEVAEEPAAEEVTDAVEPEAGTPSTDLVPLPLELPQPMFQGTPADIKVPGGKLEKPRGKPRPDFLAPEGVKNVALNKPVSASDEFPIIGEIEMLTDGDKEAADGSYVDMGPFHQYMTIDLEDTYEIYAIVLWHFHKQPRAYYDVVVQVSNDPEFAEGVTTLFNNDHDNSIGLGAGDDYHYVETSEGKLIDAKGVEARYVRFHSNGNSSNDQNHYIEAEVYGKKPE
ncbi:hypothetical protein STSP2_02459 [Anaerohalosphaera lusitana]|uniref:F5/8 type C domain-containing protein n=1 Tax=Anaerohalosphaera lusitana TaxID=1936003 RepID=A0A1U9NNS8_9BACT|nr:hypothetical protein [Anaerohalosphaera lusitana]AQT69270.1 hypothetical protein STSP2_02459 [Anaerohalosphaera lusitana]